MGLLVRVSLVLVGVWVALLNPVVGGACVLAAFARGRRVGGLS